MSGVRIALRRLLVWAAFLLLEGSKTRSEEFAPQIIDHPSDLVVGQNQPATLNCRATGNPAPTIEWYRNGERLKTTEDDATSQPTLLPDGSLFFLQFSQKKGKSDEGVYNCVARNHLGNATSKNASLYAAALREDFRLHPTDSVVTSGEQLLLECIPPKGHPEPKVSWKKNGIPINEESGHYEVSGTKLLVAHALKSHSGAYVCLATNLVGERESRAALVSVLEKPVFTRRPSDIAAKLGSTVQFMCGIHGDPMPTVQWHKEYGELPSGRYDISQENTLQIRHLIVSDAGKYICIAYNQVGIIFAKASLTVQDLLDTGQNEQDLAKGLAKGQNIRVYLANVTAVPSAPAAHLHWKVIPTSQHIEGYMVLYRALLPVNTHWAEWNIPRDHQAIVPALERGYKYEFKVRPYAGKFHGSDSNTRHLWIPEEVPSAPPQSISITMSQDGNGSGIVLWEPPPHDAHNGIIKGYQVWFLGNETHQGSNRTVDGGTHSLEATGLGYGLKYCVRVAAINGAGVGVASNPVCSALEPTVGKMAKIPDFLSANYILEVMRQPVFIASVGSALWIMLMVLAVYVCQQQARQHSKRRQYGLGEGLYRNASADTIIKHRVDSSDSPWLSNTWKSTSGSKNYSTSSSLSSQLLWTEPKDNQDFHKSTVSCDGQSQGSHTQAVPLAPDSSSSSSLYGALYVDLPAKDLKTFYGAPLPHLSSPSLPSMELARPGDQRLLPLCSQNLRIDNAKIRGAVRQGKGASPSSPNLILQASWEKNSKKELQQVHSTPTTPSGFSTDWSNHSSRISGLISGKHHRIPGETKKVLKTYSSPKFSQGSASQNVAVLLPPPPPIPPGFQVSQDHSTQQECTCTCYLEPPAASVLQQQGEDSPQTTKGSPRESQDFPTLPYNRLSAASISASLNDDRETVLTPDEVAEYLELSEEADCPRQKSDGSSAHPWAFSAPHTYGYICGQLASQLLDTDGADEDEDPALQEGGCHPTKFFRGFCRTPSSSLSEDEASLGGSLLNGWGSVSEDNGTSTRCSLVSSSDGSFLLDANFAQALAVAVDSFCFGLAQREADKALTDFLPSASPPDGIMHPHATAESLEDARQKPRPQPFPVWEWSTDWVNDMEAKYMQAAENWSSTPEFGEKKAALEEIQKLTLPLQGTNGACESDLISYPDRAVGASQVSLTRTQNAGSGAFAVPKGGEEAPMGKPAIQKQGLESSP